MEKFDKIFKDSFDNINIKSSDSNKIYNNIVSVNRNKYIISRALIFIVLFSFFTGMGVVYAKDIKEYVQEKYIRHLIVSTDGEKDEVLTMNCTNCYVELNYDADFKEMNNEIYEKTCSRQFKQLDMFYDIEIYDEPCYEFGTFEEIERELNVQLLRSTMFKKDKLIITGLDKKEGKIAGVHLENTNITGYVPVNYEIGKNYSTNKPITLVNMSVSMITKYYETTEPDIPEGTNVIRGQSLQFAEEYYIKGLNTSCIIIDVQKRRIIGTNIKYPTSYGSTIVDF
ncbi:MAG: hypothetical protein K5666_00890, partial [Bacilli bacterium]|nr:hypothetical protein [Bacilli bacterium]